MTKSENLSSVNFDKIAAGSLMYLENLSDFLKVAGDKIPETLRKEVFIKISVELQIHKYHLEILIRRRKAQVKKDLMIEISTSNLSILNAISKSDIFQKPGWGEIAAHRVVSLEEGVQKAIEFGLFGLVFFTYLPKKCPWCYRCWIKGFLLDFRIMVKTLLECHNRDNRNIRSG